MLGTESGVYVFPRSISMVQFKYCVCPCRGAWRNQNAKMVYHECYLCRARTPYFVPRLAFRIAGKHRAALMELPFCT
jgi:hypothetical protein